MVAFYNQEDQDIYKTNKFMPQSRFLLNAPKPVVEEEKITESFGIPQTQAFTNSGGGGGGGGGIQTLNPYSNSTSMSAPSINRNNRSFIDPLNQKIMDQIRNEGMTIKGKNVPFSNRTYENQLNKYTDAEFMEANPDMFDIKTDKGFVGNTMDNMKTMGSNLVDKFSGLPGVEQGKGLIRNIMDNTMIGRFAAMRDPLNPNASNYNRALQGQIDYLSGMSVDGKMMIGKDPGSGLDKYGPDSVLSGQNVVSGFGTNDYGKQLEKNLERLEGYKNPNNKTFEMIEKTKAEIAALEEEDEKNYQDRIDGFVKSYSRPGVKAMFDKVYDGKNIHGGPTDSPPGGKNSPDNYGAQGLQKSGSYGGNDTYSGQGSTVSSSGDVTDSSGNYSGNINDEFAKGGRVGYFFGGRVNFKDGGLASIL